MPITQSPTFSFNVPYALRHMNIELKKRGGRFLPESKKWSLPDSPENRSFAEQFEIKPRPEATREERVRNVAQTAAELLTALRIGQYRLIEATPERVLIEKEV